MDIRVTSVIQTYQRHLNSKPYVPSTTFGCATLAANGVANKLFIAFLFSNPSIGGPVFLKEVGLIPSSMVCLSADHKCPGASTLIVRTVTDCCVKGLHLLPQALLPRQSGLFHGFGRVTSSLWRFLFLTYDIVRHVPADTIQQEHHSAPQFSLIGSIMSRSRVRLRSVQPWTEQTHLPSIAVMSLRNTHSPHSTHLFGRRPQQVCLWHAHHHG
jgi:hypothetical protein